MKIYLIIKTERFEVSEDKETFMYALTDKDKVKEDMKHLKKDNDNNRVSFDYKEIYVANQGFAVFSKAEMSCGLNRIKWAEDLISQLPPKHEGRNSWLLNFGISEEAVDFRKSRDIKFDDNTQSAVCESVVSDDSVKIDIDQLFISTHPVVGYVSEDFLFFNDVKTAFNRGKTFIMDKGGVMYSIINEQLVAQVDLYNFVRTPQ